MFTVATPTVRLSEEFRIEIKPFKFWKGFLQYVVFLSWNAIMGLWRSSRRALRPRMLLSTV
jgi:hypothetical protein